MTGATARPVLFASVPDSGQLNTMAVLAGELARRGVPDLYFATDENRRAEIAALAARSPVEFVSTGDRNPNATAVAWDDDTYRTILGASRWKSYATMFATTFDPEAHLDKYRQLDAEVARISPALMVIESVTFHAVDVAMTRGIPFVLSVPFLPSNVLDPLLPRGFPAPYSGLPADMTAAERFANLRFRLRGLTLPFQPGVAAKARRYVAQRKELGITPRAANAKARLAAADLILGYSVFGLEYPFAAPDTLAMVGAMVPPRRAAAEDDDLSRWLAGHDSVVYMGFGTITRLTPAEVAALVAVARGLGDRHAVLWKLPKEQQTMLPPEEELPANLRVEDWLPSQLDVLAHRNVKAFLTHGGANSFHEAVYFGKPVIVRPLWLDCHDVAARAVDSGVGLAVDDEATVDHTDIVDKLTRVLTERSFTERAEHYAGLMHAAGGVRAAADRVLSHPALRY